VRNLERAGVSRSVAMKLTGHKTEAVYRRYAIVSSGDLAEASRKLQAMTGTIVTAGTLDRFGRDRDNFMDNRGDAPQQRIPLKPLRSTP
jgi:hypothetical protein